jgi:hypothetical protein
LAIGSSDESSNATGINGDQSDTSMLGAGAVYVFTRTGGTWAQEAYVRASNTRAAAGFGTSVALSADGNSLAVGASGESSNATGVNGNQADTSARDAGAAYVFTRSGTTWSQEAYVKASNTRAGYAFGTVGLSGDGNTLVVGSPNEASNATGINGNQSDTSANEAGAAYVFKRMGATWSQQAYVKASNRSGFFGTSVALSSDGSTLVIGGPDESSGATGVGGDQNNTSAPASGAAYVFTASGSSWSQQAYVKASNTHQNAEFGGSVSLSSDGNRLAVGSAQEFSKATGINGLQTDTSTPGAGAAYVFARSGASWSQEAYVKASNTRQTALFGSSVSFSADGSTLVVGSHGESSNATGINGNQADTSMPIAGAAYLFTRATTSWSQREYIKASNTRANVYFAQKLALSSDGSTLAVGSYWESSNATGINGNQSDTSAPYAGAVYVFR